MRVLIAGGTGLIGAALKRELVEGGHQVVILTRKGGLTSPTAETRYQVWDGKTAQGWPKQVGRGGWHRQPER